MDTAPEIAQSLLWEGLNALGHVNPATGVTARNGKAMLVLKDRFMLAAFAKAHNAARDAAANDRHHRRRRQGRGGR